MLKHENEKEVIKQEVRKLDRDEVRQVKALANKGGTERLIMKSNSMVNHKD